MIVLFPLWRRRWWVESVLDSDDRLDAARSHAVMNRPNKLVIPCKRARVLARSDHETMPIQVEPGIPTEVPAASRRPGPSKTRSAAIHRCGKNGARLRRPQCGRMRRKLDAIATHRLGAIERLICHIQEAQQDRNSHRPRLRRRRWPWRKAAHPPTGGWWLQTRRATVPPTRVRLGVSYPVAGSRTLHPRSGQTGRLDAEARSPADKMR